MPPTSTTLASILGPEEAEVLEFWLTGDQPPPALAEWAEDNSYRGSEFSRYSALQGAVGAVLLRDLQGRLPRSALFLPDTNFLAISRGEARRARKSNVRIVGQHLFSINWADGAPGMNWPTVYFAVWVPMRNVWVVTASDDTGEMHGFLDVALGWFSATAPWEASVKKIVTEDWAAWAADRQHACEELTYRGRLSATAIYACRSQAWPAETVEEETACEAD
jgi:hypothetical protein